MFSINQDFLLNLQMNKISAIIFSIISYIAIASLLKLIKLTYGKILKEEIIKLILNIEIFYYSLLVNIRIIWYILCLIGMSIYCYKNWGKVIDFTPFTGNSLLFVFFLILTFIPFVKRIKAYGVESDMEADLFQISKIQAKLDALIQQKKQESDNTQSPSKQIKPQKEKDKELQNIKEMKSLEKKFKAISKEVN